MAAFPATGGRAPARRRRMGRPAGWTSDKKQAFLAALVSCLNVRRAVDMVGLSAGSAYQLKRRDPDFARAWAEALDEGYSNLELELLRQAIEGCERKETMLDSKDGSVLSVKVIKSHSHQFALRLMQLHRGEVLAFRQSATWQEEGVVVARIDAQMEAVRARLVGNVETGTPGGG